MSVINQALRDLDKRGVKPGTSSVVDIAPQTNAGRDDSAEAKSARLPYVLLVFIALVVAVVYWVPDSTLISRDSTVREAVEPSGNIHLETTDASSSIAANKGTKNQLQEREPISGHESVPKHKPENISNDTKVSNGVATLTTELTRDTSSDEMPNKDQPSKATANSIQVLSGNKAPRGEALENEVRRSIQPTTDDKRFTLHIQNDAAQPHLNENRATVSASPKSLDLQMALSARRKAEAGKLAIARDELEAFIEKHTVHDASRLELATILVKMNDVSALDALLATQTMWAEPEMRMIAARRQMQLNAPDEAYRILRASLPPIELQPHYYALMASIEQTRGRHIEQIDLYQRLIQAHGDRAKWWLGSAIAWDQLERYGSAKKAYIKAQQLNLSDPRLMAFVDQRLKQLRGHQ